MKDKRKIIFLCFVSVLLCRSLFAFGIFNDVPHDTVIIDGQNNHLNLSSTSTIYVSEDERLILKNLRLNNLSGTRLIMEGPNSHLELQNMKIVLDGDYSLTVGTILFKDTVTITGTFTFGFNSSQNSTIDTYSTLIFDGGSTYSFGAIGTQGIIYYELGAELVTGEGSIASSVISMTFIGGTVIVLGDTHITLASTDVINIIGSNNEIHVTNIFTIQGNLDFAEGGELTFVFDDQGDNPTVVFDRAGLTLPKNARLAFRGNGSVVFSDGFVLTMNGTIDTDRPEINFIESATATIAASTTGNISRVYFRGYGTIFLDSGGEIRADTMKHWTIGGAATDNFVIFVDRGASIRAIGANSRISIYLATVSMDFEQRGSLVAAFQGVVEINALMNSPAGGTLTSLTFDTDGALNSRKGGVIVIGENTNSATFNWNSKGGDVFGEGEIMLAEQNAFSGIGKGVGRIFSNTAITTEELVRRLVNLKNPDSVLPQSTVFENVDGDQYIRIKNSTFLNVAVSAVPIRKLSSGDNVTGETARSIGGLNTNKNRRFEYDLDGTRAGSRWPFGW